MCNASPCEESKSVPPPYILEQVDVGCVIVRADSTNKKDYLRCATDIVRVRGFSLRNAILTRTDTIIGSLLVLTLSEIVVIEAGSGTEHHSK